MVMDDEPKRMRWQDLDGAERYRIVELMRSGEVEIHQLCRTFGVSRQTLYRAAEAADSAAVAALTRKPRGRKPEPVTTKQLKELRQQKKQLERELHQMSQRYEVAQTLLDLQRQAQRKELPGPEKKTPHRLRRPGARGAAGPSGPRGMADRDVSQSDGGDRAGGDGVAPPPKPDRHGE
jgi:transposase-like protein